MASGFGTGLGGAVPPLVVALDVGSTASRGAVYDAHGRPVGRRAKVPHAFTTSADGTSEIDPDQVVAELRSLLEQLTAPLGAAQVAGVALDTFASSMVVVDSAGRALTPCFTYADGRCGSQVIALREEVRDEELQQRTGTRVHASYWPARLRWLAQERTEVVARAAHYLSLGDYVLLQLTGTLATGTSTAAWTGMVDRHTADWHPEVVELAGIGTEQLPALHHLDQPLTVLPDAAARIASDWPALAEARWFAPVADGLAANVGLGAADASSVGGSCATSGALRVLVREMPEELPGGLWCYRVSHDRSLVGGAVNDVGRALAWAEGTLDLARVDPDSLSAALAAEPQDSTPLVLPFLTGERSTGWAASARAVVTGVGESAGPAELYRGVVEGVALTYARIAGQLRQVAPESERLFVGGRVTHDRPELLQVLADTLGTPVTPVRVKRTTLHGTALLALESLAPDVERIRPEQETALTPVEPRRAYYAERLERFERTYRALFA